MPCQFTQNRNFYISSNRFLYVLSSTFVRWRWLSRSVLSQVTFSFVFFSSVCCVSFVGYDLNIIAVLSTVGVASPVATRRHRAVGCHSCALLRFPLPNTLALCLPSRSSSFSALIYRCRCVPRPMVNARSPPLVGSQVSLLLSAAPRSDEDVGTNPAVSVPTPRMAHRNPAGGASVGIGGTCGGSRGSRSGSCHPYGYSQDSEIPSPRRHCMSGCS